MVTDGTILTVEQVAERLQLSPRSIRRAIAEQGLRAIRLGASYRILEDDLVEWLEQRATRPRDAPATEHGKTFPRSARVAAHDEPAAIARRVRRGRETGRLVA